MGAELAELVDEVRKTALSLEQGDAKATKRMEAIEKSLDALCVKVNRPGAMMTATDQETLERKEAIGLCYVRRSLTVPKDDGSAMFVPSHARPIGKLVCQLRAVRNSGRECSEMR